MGRLANDGRGRLGGRTKGTPNRPKEPICDWITGIINSNRKAIEDALKTPQTPEGMNLIAGLLVYSALIDRQNTVEDNEQGL